MLLAGALGRVVSRQHESPNCGSLALVWTARPRIASNLIRARPIKWPAAYAAQPVQTREPALRRLEALECYRRHDLATIMARGLLYGGR